MYHARYEDAAAMFSHVVSLAPDSFTGYSNLGGVRAFEGKYAEAVPLFEKSLSIRPTGDARSNLATAYFQMHRYADSAAQFEQAVQLDSKNYIFWGNLGDAYYWAPGRRSEAPAAYGQAITIGEEKLRLNPNDAVLLSSLAIYHAMRGEKKPALDNLDSALRLQPQSPGSYSTPVLSISNSAIPNAPWMLSKGLSLSGRHVDVAAQWQHFHRDVPEKVSFRGS